MARVNLGTVAIAAGGNGSVLLAGLPEREGSAGVSYLARLWFDLNLTLTVGNGGQTLDPPTIHKILSQVSVTDASGRVWGPDALDGSELSALRYVYTAEPIPYDVDAAGDSQAANNAGAITRRVLFAFDWAAMGYDEEDFTPPCAALKDGQVKVVFSALPTNVTAMGGTLTIYAESVPAMKQKVAARLRVSHDAVPAKVGPLNRAGLLTAVFLERTDSNITAGEVATFTLLDADGNNIMRTIDPQVMRPAWLNENPEVTTARIQRHFNDGIAGTWPRFLPLIPFEFVDGGCPPATRLPASHKFNYEMTGTLTVANYQFLIAAVEPLDRATLIKHGAHCGCDAGIIASKPTGDVFTPMGANGVPIKDGRILPYMPHVVRDPSVLKG